jgi:hypothetical protein
VFCEDDKLDPTIFHGEVDGQSQIIYAGLKDKIAGSKFACWFFSVFF